MGCPDGEFECERDGTCIDANLICNGIEDCLLGEDETYEYADCENTGNRRSYNANKCELLFNELFHIW